MSGRIPATLIPGDGIGPEITEAVTSVLDALGSPFEWDVQYGGMAGIERGGDPLPGSLIDSIRGTNLALKGPFKANVLKALTGLFLQAGREIAKEYEGRVAMDDRIVDACAMQLVMNPWQFDVIVTTNLFGDILSDQMSGLVGGLGMARGANIGERAAIFEAVHGSAPDIAGKGVANPLALLLAAGLMLKHVDEPILPYGCGPPSSRPCKPTTFEPAISAARPVPGTSRQPLSSASRIEPLAAGC